MTVLWLCYYGSSTFLRHNNEPFQLSPPNSAHVVVYMDGKQLFNEALTATFITTKDEGISSLLLKRLSSEKRTNKRLGLDLLNEVVLFSDLYESKKITGFIFKIAQPDLWKKNSISLRNAHTYTFESGNTAIVLVSDQLSAKELDQYARHNLNKSSRRATASLAPTPISFELAATHGLPALEGTIRIAPDQLLLNGTVNLHPIPEEVRLKHALLPGAFHLTCDIFPEMLDEWRALLPNDLGLPIEKISGISMNYKGLEIENGNNGILPLPELDLIVSFRTSISTDTILRNIQALYPQAVLTKNSIRLDGTTYHVQSLSSNTLYIGRSENPTFQRRSEKTVLSMQGSLEPFLQVKGGRILTAMIKMSEPYQQLDQWDQKIDALAFTLTRTHGNRYELLGKVQFQHEKNAMVEVVRALLQSDL